MNNHDPDFFNYPDSVYEGFFSRIYLKCEYAYKVLKKYQENEKEILLEEFFLGSKFSPQIYKKVLSFQGEQNIRYALKMRRIEGDLLSKRILQMREKDRYFLQSKEIEILISKILNSLIEGYNRVEKIETSKLSSKDGLVSYFDDLVSEISNFDILNEFSDDFSLETLIEIFTPHLKDFTERLNFMNIPINHGDLSSNNIFLSESQESIIIIDPYPERLNSVSFKHSIPNPKFFSFFYDLACLKLSIHSFQSFKDSFNVFDRIVDSFSYFSSYMDTKHYMSLWELIVTLRQIVVLFFNIKYEEKDKDSLNKSLYLRYKMHLENLVNRTV